MSAKGSQQAQLLGSLFAATGAFCYGITIVVGRELARAGFGSSPMLGLRFTIAGVTLALVLTASGRPVLPAPGERVRAFLLGAVGYGLESTCFYLALSKGTAAAVALLFYSYPAVVTVLEIPLRRALPSRRTVVALTLSGTGAALIALAGDRIHLAAAGIGFAMASAVAFSLYLLAGERLLRRTDALTSGAWVALGAGVALLSRSSLSGSLEGPSGYWPQMLVYGLATAAAFTLMFAALKRIGSSRTAVVMTLEAFFAIVLTAIFLGESVGVVQAVGGVAILGAAAIIGLSPTARGRPEGTVIRQEVAG